MCFPVSTKELPPKLRFIRFPLAFALNFGVSPPTTDTIEFFFDYIKEMGLDSLVVTVLGLLEAGVILEESSTIVVRLEVKCISIALGLVSGFCTLTDVMDWAANFEECPEEGEAFESNFLF